MTNKANLRIGSLKLQEMARILFCVLAMGAVGVSGSIDEVALTNVTRYATGDYFSLVGSDCGPTRCMELTHGTALASIGTDVSSCRCQCRKDTPAFREDHGSCVNHIDECLMASFGRGASKPQIPYVFLPLKGQIIYPSKEIVFTDVEDAICAVTSAQYLSSSGWVTLRDLVDNDVPFGLYRDEGNTFLQWRGSAALHSRLEGRLVAVHVLCSAAINSRLAASCAAFRIAGAAQNALLDVRSIPFHAGEIVSSEVPQNQGLSVLESLAIGVCVLLLVFVYAAGIIFYVHYKQRQKISQNDPDQNHTNTMSTDNGSLEARIDMSNVMLKTNPLLKLNGDFFHDENIPDVCEHSEEDSSSHNTHINTNKKLNSNVISAMVHSRRKKTLRPSIRSATPSEVMNERFQRRSMSPDALERAPHSELSIIDCSLENNFGGSRQLPPSNGENVYRRKLYFNPVFFETEHLKNPPPAAVEFLTKIREVMSIAKEKMTSKRYLPILSDIPEEDLYQTIDLGWDFPCARRGRRFSAISLKQENSRKTAHCGGCPGCDNSSRSQKTIALTRSSSCKTCVSDDYKQRIVRKWLDEVPTVSSNSKPIKSISKISGTPRTIEDTKKENIHTKSDELIKDNNKIPSVTYSKPKNNDIEQSRIEFSSKFRDNKDIFKDNKITLKESRPTVIDLTPKQTENKSAISEIKPKIGEIVPKGCHDKVVKEHSMPENKFDEIKVKQTNFKQIEIIKVENDSEKVASPVITNLEKKSPPPSHTSRRIRKKLPPPPPPPVSPPEPPEEEEESIPPEVKVKMEAVIREIKTCRRIEPTDTEDEKIPSPTPPKLIIPVMAADSHYFSDDNVLTLSKKKDMYDLKNTMMDFDSMDRNIMKRRRFSVACAPELSHRERFEHSHNMIGDRDRVMSTSWRDMRKAVDNTPLKGHKHNVGEIFINNYMTEPIYDNVQDLAKPGPLTIEVRGSPVEARRSSNKDDVDFDPDTLDRRDNKKRIEKILLKSAGSFKYKTTSSESESCRKSPVGIETRKIGNLREIYEAKAKAQEEEMKFYSRRQSITYGQDLSAFMRSVKAPDLIRHIEGQSDPKPPIPPHQRRPIEISPKFATSARGSPLEDRRRMSEDRDRFQQYTRVDNLNARRSGRRSARTRSRRTDLRKLYRTEDSGYMSTDSNESKRRARYLMQLRPVKPTISEQVPIPNIRAVVTKPLVLQMESDTDDLESLWDGRSESGGESVETDSVFFGNFDDSKEMLAELGLNSFEPQGKILHTHEQIDSGFMGETNIILSGDSDSEHRSVISITTGHEGRASVASLSNLDDAPYMQTIEC